MKSVLKKFLAFVVSVGMLFALSPSAAHAENTGESSTDWEISKSKTATNLDADYTSEVTLSLPSAQEELVSDVVFVLDKSSSARVENQILEMLQELNTQIQSTDATVKVGIVIFNKQANRVLELTELNDENMAAIETAIKTEISSGTNTHAGLLAGKAMLDEDQSVEASRKYLIFASDGNTYMYGAQPTVTAYYWMSDGSPYFSFDNYAWSFKYGSDDAPADWNAWMSNVQTAIENSNAIEIPYEGEARDILNGYRASKEEIPENLATAADGLQQNAYATNVDRALYYTYQVYNEAQNEGYHCYAVNSKDTVSSAAWAKGFMDYLNGGNEEVSFSEIQKDIYYLLDAGSTVTDYMGYAEGEYDFDFVNDPSTLRLMVGDEVYEAVEIAENTYGFKPSVVAKSTADYAYVVEYVPGEGGQEHFVWHINEAVSNFAPVQLTYKVVLTNPSTQPGTYGSYDADGSKGMDGLYTNLSAVLTPVDTNGNMGKEEAFARPTVSYTVESPVQPSDDPTETPQEPATPSDEKPVAETTPDTDTANNLALWFVLFTSCAALSAALYMKRRMSK